MTPATPDEPDASPDRSASPRWRRRKQERPAELLEAAFATFAERGFAAARLEEVARRAGVTKGTLYLYFDGKESLFEAVVRDQVARDADATTAPLPEGASASEALVDLLEEWWQGVADTSRATVARLVAGEAAQFPVLASLVHAEVLGRRLKRIEHVLRLGMARGEFRRVDPALAVRLSVMPLLAAAMWAPARSGEDPLEARRYFDAHVDLLLHGLRASRD